MAELIVVGSYNAGLTIYSDRLPVPGETVLGHGFDSGPGGKGANQAIGAARLGADVLFVTQIGDDEFGGAARKLLRAEGLPERGMLTSRAPTGVAMILVDASGTNMISVAPGANLDLTASAVTERFSKEFEDCRLLLLQLECAADLAVDLAAWARRRGITTILNPAPARKFSGAELALFDILTPNEIELNYLAGGLGLTGGSPEQLAKQLISVGVSHVVVTLGAQGALWMSEAGCHHFSPPRIDPVDTTGCGDAFNAAFAAALVRGGTFPDAVAHGCRAGAYCATRRGVIDGLATTDALTQLGR